MSNLAIIPARGGSKRIPRKNIRNFLGKPIIAYSIETAIESGLFEQVMVSTDDEEIAEVAVQYGASVPFMRSAENSDDFSGTADVLLEVMDQYQSLEKSFTSGCCIYPTAPFVTGKKLMKSFALFQKNQYDTLFPVVEFSSPIQRALKVNQEGKVQMFWPENMQKRSQDLETAYHDAGQFYYFRPEKLSKQKQVWTDNSGVVVYPETEVQDIDNEEDWKMAEIKYRWLQSN